MPQIEKGEHFVVTRGFKMEGTSDLMIFAIIGNSQPPKPSEPKYDRSYEGYIFLAVSVCGPMICGKVVYSPHGKSSPSYYKQIDACYSINTTEVEVWPLTKEFFENIKLVEGA